MKINGLYKVLVWAFVLLGILSSVFLLYAATRDVSKKLFDTPETEFKSTINISSDSEIEQARRKVNELDKELYALNQTLQTREREYQELQCGCTIP